MELSASEISNLGATMKWFASNYEEIAKGREGTFIAIKDREIVAESENFEGLLRTLEKLKIDPSSVFIDSIAPRSFACIL